MNIHELRQKRIDIEYKLLYCAPHATRSLEKQINKAKTAFVNAREELNSLELQLEAVNKLKISLDTDLAATSEQYLKGLFSDIHAFTDVFNHDEDMYNDGIAGPLEDYLRVNGNFGELYSILLNTFQTEFAKAGMKFEVKIEKTQIDDKYDKVIIPIFKMYVEIVVDGNVVRKTESDDRYIVWEFNRIYENFKEKLQLEESVEIATKKTERIKI